MRKNTCIVTTLFTALWSEYSSVEMIPKLIEIGGYELVIGINGIGNNNAC